MLPGSLSASEKHDTFLKRQTHTARIDHHRPIGDSSQSKVCSSEKAHLEVLDPGTLSRLGPEQTVVVLAQRNASPKCLRSFTWHFLNNKVSAESRLSKLC